MNEEEGKTSIEKIICLEKYRSIFTVINQCIIKSFKNSTQFVTLSQILLLSFQKSLFCSFQYKIWPRRCRKPFVLLEMPIQLLNSVPVNRMYGEKTQTLLQPLQAHWDVKICLTVTKTQR